MQNLEEIAEEIEKELDEKDTIREIALKSCRAVIRLSGGAIGLMHKEEKPESLLMEAKDEVSKLRALVREHNDLSSAGFVEDAYQEMAEASILYAILHDEDPPFPEELEITSTSYLMGMGDVVGELRRVVLDSLRTGETEEAQHRLEQMEQIFDILMRFDYPSAIVNIRRKQDIARTLVEKTRGDVTMAVRSKKLEEKLDRFSAKKSSKSTQKKN